MKTFVNRKTIKNLIIIMFALIIFSVMLPKPVFAETDVEDGGGIWRPLEDFMLFLDDKVMQWLQKTFTSVENIEVDEGVYDFKYSPAIIFSGKVNAFDINFINPNQKDQSSSKYSDYIEKQAHIYFTKKNDDDSQFKNAKSHAGYGYVASTPLKMQNSRTKYKAYYWEEGGRLHIACEFDGGWGIYLFGTKRYHYYYTSVPIDDPAIAAATETKTYTSIAYQLQSTIATWYNALRKIALVGLLSVLVYVGIRMVLSSSAGDKAKYKAMIKDWVVAICILFTLHYIMSITITVTNEISGIFNPGESDVLLNTLRNEIFSESDTTVTLAKTLMYTMLVWLTISFTVQYIKRVVYMAFYTLIAPLITLTYPLDKIKDGQAQAFTMWIREYVYTALTQVIHLVIYTVLVGSALELVSKYPLYAIVVMFCIKKADGVIKKMFGFDKSETVGAIGSAATGALIMNAINKISGKSGGKKSSSQAGSSGEEKTNVRMAQNNMATDNALASLRGQSPANGNNAKPNLGNGAFSLVGKYGGAAVKGMAKVGTALPLAALGFAAGAAEGDFGGAVKGALAGGAAGKALGGRIGTGIADGILGGGYLDSATKAIDGVKDTWNSAAYGDQFAKDASEAREFKRTGDYQALKAKYGDDLTDDKIRAMMQAGMNDKGSMEKALSGGNLNDQIGYYTLAKKCPDSIYYDNEKLQNYLEDLGLSASDANTIRQNMRQYR